MKTVTQWKSGFAFDSHFKGNTIAPDDTTASGGDDSGFSPNALLLSGLPVKTSLNAP